MNKEELWVIYVRKNPSFVEATTITLTTVGLRKLFDQTFDHAHEEGYRKGKEAQSLYEQMYGKRKAGESIFDDIFGKKSL